MRISPDDTTEMVSQLLYGDIFEVKELRKHWAKVEIPEDGIDGWVRNIQLKLISEEDFREYSFEENREFSLDFIAHIRTEENILQPITLGSRIDVAILLGHSHEGRIVKQQRRKSNLVNTALSFLNTPYLWGGKTVMGIDGSGFVQMVYRLNGFYLFRNTDKQATQGEALSFIEESEPGDLAFFDNNEGLINHVGIILKDNYIVHAHGRIRIDRIDHTGIFNTQEKLYTHKLRVIKRIA